MGGTPRAVAEGLLSSPAHPCPAPEASSCHHPWLAEEAGGLGTSCSPWVPASPDEGSLADV